MSDVLAIRRRIQAVTETKKITGAMELVSSSRMRRIMSHIEYNSRYFQYIRNAMREILTVESEFGEHDVYLTLRENPRKIFVVFTGDKGLCGDYNDKVIRKTEQMLAEFPGSSLITIGYEAERYFEKRGIIPDLAMYGIVQDPTMKAARHVSRELLQIFDERLADEINVIYTAFYGAMKGIVRCDRVLPILQEDYTEYLNIAGQRFGNDDSLSYSHEMEYMPSRQEVFPNLVPQYVLGLIFGFMVQAYAAEHYARMNAMHASGQNASDMLNDLQTQYNLARQSAITNEIAEISSAGEVLKEG